ncbi:MAG: hypothetical protein ACR2IE_13015 [Candidatus Sumerlaeaceae bacterium]
MSARRAQVTQTCPSCDTIQELPAIFCWHCGAPLMRISYWYIAFFLSFTAAMFGIYGLYAQSMVWPIPLYLFHVLIFVALSLIITRRYYWTSFRVILWTLLLLYAMTFLVLSAVNFFHNLSTDVIEVMQHVRATYLGIAVLGGMALFNLILGSVALTRRFKFTLAYRIFVTFLILLAYAGGKLLEEPDLGEPKKMSALAMWLPDTTISEFLNVLSVNLLRILTAEMVVYSVVLSFAPANAKFAPIARKILRPQHSDRQAQSIVLNATSQITLAIVRAGIYIQYFFITLWKTLSNYAWGMYRVLRRLTIDFVTPVVSLGIASFLLAVISEHIAAYLTGVPNPRLVFIPGIHAPLAMIGISVLGVVLVHMLFLAAVTKFSLADLWRCNALLALWIGPFFFAVFLFVSLSLIATGTVLRRWGHDKFPYHFGPLTLVAAVVMILMVGFALLYRQRGHTEGLGVGVRRRLMLAAPAPHADDDQGSAK